MNEFRSGVSETLAAIMFGLQRAANRRISYASMASSLGVSQRAFAEWMRGAREPAAMEALLRMLSMLPDDEVSRVLNIWREKSQPPPTKHSGDPTRQRMAKKKSETTAANRKPVRRRTKDE
jgi:hypothetical protein